MADRYQDKPFPADDDTDRGAQRTPAKGDGDPLAELARLIGQTDPFANFGRANQPMPPRESDPYHREPEPEPEIDQGPPTRPAAVDAAPCAAGGCSAAGFRTLGAPAAPLRRRASACRAGVP